MKIFTKIIEKIESSHNSLILGIVSFLSIILIRLLVENWLQNFRSRSGLLIFYEFTHTLLFFLIAYLLFVFTLSYLLKNNIKSTANILLWGYLIILTPPIIDNIISRGEGFWSFYKFDSLIGLIKRFFTFFGDKPEIGITYGVRIEVALALIFIFVYSFVKLHPFGKPLKIFVKSLWIVLITYVIFFILGTFPSWIAIITQGFSKGFFNVSEVDIVEMFLTPIKIFSREIPDIISALNIKMSIVYSLFLTLLIVIKFWFTAKNKFLAIIKNARPPQLIYHGGLLTVGLILGTTFFNASWSLNFFNILSFLLLGEAVLLAWLASVVVNDIQDQQIDAISNANRPLIKKVLTLEEYKILGWIFFVFSILFSAIVNFKIALFLLVYQALAWLYSCWPLRLKRFPLLATFTSAIASLMIIFSGFILASPNQNIQQFPSAILWLLIISYTLSLPIKDFKDIEGDKRDKIYTFPVLFGEQWGKIIVGGGVFISYLLSVILFNEFRLFWWAFICGSFSFWLINQMKKPAENHWLNYRNIFWWILGIVSFYGFVLMQIIFLK